MGLKDRLIAGAASLVVAWACEGSWGQSCPTWALAGNSPIGPNYGHAMVYDGARRRVMLVGGHGNLATRLWNGFAWELASTEGPSYRRWHAMAYDSERQRTVVFGGADSGGATIPTRETWEWNGSGWALVATVGPSPRTSPAMTFDAERRVTVLFGGSYSGGLGDTWEWNGTSWSQRAATGPSARTGAAMAYDPLRRRVVLFGGDSGGEQGDTWEWDGAVWLQVAATGPSGRRDAAMAYDPSRGRVVLFGGSQYIFDLTDTWEWDGSSWVQRSVGQPTLAKGDGAFDHHRSRFVVHGRSATSAYHTWELPSTSIYISQHPIGASIGLGAPLILSVDAAGVPPVSFRWRKNGVFLVDGGTISGVNTPTLTIDPAMPGDAGSYDVRVTDACGSVLSQPAPVAVRCDADCNGDGVLNVQDYICFQTRFALGCK